jgi:AbrB family looped-hinge helix DNA binding protein
MIQSFKVKVVAKRQVTIPKQLLDLLRIGEGDYLEFVGEEGKKELRVSGLTLAPTNLFSDEVLTKLDQRERDIERGRRREVRDLSTLTADRALKAGHGRQ